MVTATCYPNIATFVIAAAISVVSEAYADGRYEIPLSRTYSHCTAGCSISGNVYGLEYGDTAHDEGGIYALAELAPGPGAFVSNPDAEAGGSNYAFAGVNGANANNLTFAGGYPDVGAGNEPPAWADLIDTRGGTADATWEIVPSGDDATWIESTITIVNESGEDPGDPCDIEWTAGSWGRVIVGSTDFTYYILSDGTIIVSGTLVDATGSHDISGLYYGTTLTFYAYEQISPEVPFQTYVQRGAEIDMYAFQQCGWEWVGLEDGGYAYATLHAYQSISP